jgi:hypothetical protein
LQAVAAVKRGRLLRDGRRSGDCQNGRGDQCGVHLVLEERFDLAFECDRQRLAAAIESLADCGANPALGHAVFLNIRALHVVEPNANVPFKELRIVVAARWINAKSVW